MNPDTDFYLESAIIIISEHASKLDIGDELKLKFKNKVKDAANNKNIRIICIDVSKRIGEIL